MKIYLKKSIFLYSGTLLFLFSASMAGAATLFSLPKSVNLKVGQNFDVELKVNSQGQAFNAAQATIQFPKDLLEVKSIDYSPAASTFNFWLTNPTFSNTAGTINFVGGTTNGISGNSIPILKITFLAKGVGNGGLAFNNTAVTASDGSGTNILSMMEITTFNIAQSTGAAAGASAPAPVLPPPVLITRTPVAASGLPEKPVLSMPLYPDQKKWYNLASDFLAQWNLPADISGVSTAINESPIFVPPAKSEGLFDSKMFAGLGNGIHYLHVRFWNNKGWGPTADYRIAIDTAPPLPFKITSKDGFKTGNPSPSISFVSNDGISGIADYILRVDNMDGIISKNSTSILPLLGPGQHHIIIRAVDNAGNFTEDSVDFEILPIASPTINFVQPDIFVGQNSLSASGTSLPGTTVLFSLKKDDGSVEYQSEVPADANGNWQIAADHFLSIGKYYVEVRSKDKRFALSLPVKSDPISVREKPVLVIGGFEVTQFWLFMDLIILLLFGFSLGWISYRLWIIRIEGRALVTKRDFSNLLAIIDKDLESAAASLEGKDSEEKNRTEAKFYSARAKQNVEKMKKYLVEEIGEISR